MPITGPPGKRWTLLMRGLCGAPHLITCYVSFRLMPFADASTIVFAAPVFVSIIGCLLLDEECGIFQILTVTVAMIGVVLISKPQFLMGQETTDDPFKETRTAGTVVALSSSILAASSFLMVRKLKECPAFVIVNYNSLVALVCAGTAILFIRAFFYDEEPEWGQFVVPQTKHDIGLLLGNGMCALVGQVLVTMALRIEEASLVSLARTIDVVMAFIYQMIWLTAEAVQWTSFAGAFLVCSCVSLATLRRWLKDKPGKYDTLWIILNCGIARKQMIQPEG